MAIDQDTIQEMVGEKEERSDTSLHSHALHRALNQHVPKTLTPYEWEQWYAVHGVPESHRQISARPRKASWWRFWDNCRK
jgi:hypothetical protein